MGAYAQGIPVRGIFPFRGVQHFRIDWDHLREMRLPFPFRDASQIGITYPKS
jgi:hypothetical protein